MMLNIVCVYALHAYVRVMIIGGYYDNNNNNNNNHDNVYGAVIMAEPLRVHPVHLMNVAWRQAAADPRPSQTT